MRPTRLPLDKIRMDGGTQVRVRLDDATVDKYAELILDDHKLDAIEVLFDGNDYWPWDGFHRIAAHRKAKHTTIPAIVRQGGRQDALKLALGANRNHGLPLSNADKAKAVDMALTEFPDMSCRAIAELVGVSESMVRQHKEVNPGAHGAHVVGKDGKTYPASRPKPNVDDIPFDDTGETSPGGKDAASEAPKEAEDDDNPLPPATKRISLPPKIAEAFKRRPELTRHANVLAKERDAIQAAIDGGDRLYAHLNLTAFVPDLNNAINRIRASRPHAVCPWCSGDGCKNCHGEGWVTKLVYDRAPEGLK